MSAENELTAQGGGGSTNNDDSPSGASTKKQNVQAVEVGPNDRMVFSIIPLTKENKLTLNGEFTPEYYPDRFNKKLKKELDRSGQQCKGEDVSIKSFKNSELHATGVCTAESISTIEGLAEHDGPVDLITPISPNGGLEAFIEEAEVGEIEGWNPQLNTWMFNYTIDLVSTGKDDYSSNKTNDVVTSLLNQEGTTPEDVYEQAEEVYEEAEEAVNDFIGN